MVEVIELPSGRNFASGFYDMSLSKEVSIAEADKILIDHRGSVNGYIYGPASQGPRGYKYFKRAQCGVDEHLPGWTSRALRLVPYAISSSGLFEDDFSCRDEACIGAAMPSGWRRPGRGEGLADGVCSLFGLPSSSDDVRQGLLGDCWLLAPLMALCHKSPALVEQLFPDQCEISGQGSYTVQLFNPARMHWEPIVLDDRLPVNAAGDLLFQAIPSSGALWPCLVEKAAAMWTGSYGQLSVGHPGLAMSMLTGSTDVIVFRSPLKGGGWLCRKLAFDEDEAAVGTRTLRVPCVAPWDTREHEPLPDGTAGGPELNPDAAMIQALAYYANQGCVISAATRGTSPDIHEFAVLKVDDEQKQVCVQNPGRAAQAAMQLLITAQHGASDDEASEKVWLRAADFAEAFGCVTVCR